jgi:hypothetical protein
MQYVTVPIPSTTQPPPIPCEVMGCLVWILVMKSSRCGEIEIKALESMIRLIHVSEWKLVESWNLT